MDNSEKTKSMDFLSSRKMTESRTSRATNDSDKIVFMNEVNQILSNSSDKYKSQDQEAVKKSKVVNYTLALLAATLLMGGAAYGGYYFRDVRARDEIYEKNLQIKQLNEQISGVEGGADTCDDASGIEDGTIAQVEAAISSKNLAALDSLFVNEVEVFDGSNNSFVGQTKDVAISKLGAFIDDQATTWSYDVDEQAATDSNGTDLASFIASGENGAKILMAFNCHGKIGSISMTEPMANENN